MKKGEWRMQNGNEECRREKGEGRMGMKKGEWKMQNGNEEGRAENGLVGYGSVESQNNESLRITLSSVRFSYV